MFLHMYTNINIYTRTHTHTHIYKYIYIYIYICVVCTKCNTIWRVLNILDRAIYI